MDKNPLAPLLIILGVLLIVALAFFGMGVYIAANQGSYAMLAAGMVCVMGVLLAMPFAWALRVSRERDSSHQNELLTTVTDRLESMSIILNLISEQQLLSDRAKAVAFREKDREAVRRAIYEEIGRHDYEAALSLANDIETNFGYRAEAERLRQEIRAKRGEIVRRQVTDAVAVIDRHIRGEQWQAAQSEAQRVMAQFPDDEQVQRLPQDIESRRQAHKNRLLETFNDAVSRHDVDGGIEILKQLDLYLTPTEAESLQDSARGVFKEKIHNLRTKFTIAVQDHKWAEAVAIGESIMRDFPNTKMAQEVREKLDMLKKRATASGQVAAPAEV
jgi:hypothetical protein